MPEIKNTFLKSKMNKDLDDRIIPNGEYREGQNIAVSKSEESDVGALENVLGNALSSNLGLSGNCGISIIGKYMDDSNNRMILFITDYTDSSTDRLSNFAPSTAVCQVLSYYPLTNTVFTLTSGRYLNFSKTHFIYGINIIEDLLFWTDNRNQPRKLNITSGESSPTYYNSEDEISVAKYYPWQPINLYRDSGIPESISLLDPAEPGTNYTAPSIGIATSVSPVGGTGLTVSYGAVGGGGEITGVPGITVAGTGYNNGDIVTIEEPGHGTDARYTINTRFDSTMLDTCTALLPYSLVTSITVTSAGSGYTPGAAFTKQETLGGTGSGLTLTGTITGGGAVSGTPTIANTGVGYTNGDVITLNGPGGSNATIQLTVATLPNPDYDSNWPGDCVYLRDKFIRFSYRFKFDDNEYSLIAPFTQTCFVPKQDGYFMIYDEDRTYKSSEVGFMENKVTDISLIINSPTGVEWVSMFDRLKITEVDILYKESNGLSVKLVDTIKSADFPATGEVLEYKYQSKKPTKVLPENTIIRVSDKVPVRAMAQEVSGNRIIYANYADKHSSPSSLDYNVSVSEKTTYSSSAPVSYVTKEYQNHTLKQNRNYQVGIILCDKYGRQSDVVLSSADTSISATAKGSTLYHPYKDSTFTDSNLINQTDTWPGDSLKIAFNTLIPSTVLNQPGYPGLYSATNPLGWHSYKVVVKQTQQSYYNVYFPGILNGFTEAATGEPATYADPIGHMVLIGDNINKIPKDLQDVGPNQNQFKTGRPSFDQDPSYYQFDSYVNGNGELVMGHSIDPNTTDPNDLQLLDRRDALRNIHIRNSSVLLYGRVTNFMSGSTVSNKRINPGTGVDSVITIGTVDDLSLVTTAVPLADELYLASTNPYVGRLELNDISVGAPYDAANTMIPFLAVSETEAAESALDIFWDTSTSGLISDLNTAITDSDAQIPTSIDTPTTNIFPESKAPSATVTSTFFARNDTTALTSATMVLRSVLDGHNTNVTSDFVLTNISPGEYRLDLQAVSNPFYYAARAQSNAFTVYINVSNTTYRELFSFDLYLSNITPSFNAVIASPAAASTSGGQIGFYEGRNGAFTLYHNELDFSVTSEVSPMYFYLLNTAPGFVTLHNVPTTPAGTYDLVIELCDPAECITTALQVVVT